MRSYCKYLTMPDDELSAVDFVELNLAVARSIPSLSGLDISRYQAIIDKWALEIRQLLPSVEREFHETPIHWKNDIHFFRLGYVIYYLGKYQGIEYNEDQREVKSISYTNPSDLFLNGVIDTRRGTCGNMSTLHTAICRRLGWQVSLACTGSHFICRYDDGQVKHNIEASYVGQGAFKSPPDDWYVKDFRLSPAAIFSGSDLTYLTQRQMFGLFIGLRARHMRDIGEIAESEIDYLLALTQFPKHRTTYSDALAVLLPRGSKMYMPGEVGAPDFIAQELQMMYGGYPPYPLPSHADSEIQPCTVQEAFARYGKMRPELSPDWSASLVSAHKVEVTGIIY